MFHCQLRQAKPNMQSQTGKCKQANAKDPTHHIIAQLVELLFLQLPYLSLNLIVAPLNESILLQPARHLWVVYLEIVGSEE